MEAFPKSTTKKHGGTRVTLQNSNRTGGLEVVTLDMTVNDAHAIVSQWFEMQSSTRILVNKPGYIYAISLTLLMGFPDNVAVSISPVANDATKCVIEFQAENRLGVGDLGVNVRRAKAFYSFLLSQTKKN